MNNKGLVNEQDIKRHLMVATPKAKSIIHEVDGSGKGALNYDDFVGIWVKRRKPKKNVTEAKKEAPQIGVQIGLKLCNSDNGLAVDIAQPGLPAAQAGVQRGDTILKVNGKTVESVDDFRQVGQSFVAGTRAIFVIQRAGRNQVVTLRL